MDRTVRLSCGGGKQVSPAPARRTIDDVSETPAGDDACWADRVCDACGAVVADGPGVRALPDDVTLVRATDVFNEDTVPAGLLREHRVADGVWGRLVVDAGCLGFRFEDEDRTRHVSAGGSIVIPPQRLHHVDVDGPVQFRVEFHRAGENS